MPEVKITAETRTEFGKGAARRSRREGRVPAVLYGHGTETRHLTLPGHDLMLALKTPNVLLRVEGLRNGSEIALPKAVQRDPVRNIIEHVDLILVRRGEKVTIEVPVRVTGDIAPGDGMINQQLVQIPLEAEATNIPQGIDVDVDGMEIGQAVHASDLKLPSGVTLQVEPETLVLAVIARTTAEQPEEEAEEEVPEAPEAVADQAAAGDRQSEGAQAGLTGERWIIAGLGNPGPEYAGNRHNAGHMVTALLAGRAGVRFKAHRSGNDVAEGRLTDVPVTLARPRSYMNLSGKPVAALAAFYKIPPDRLVVIHDELDIPFGAVRLKFGGGDNGHNGLRSITQALGTRDYYRVRFGIGRPPGRMEAASYVLRDFSPAERKDLPLFIDRAADATETLIAQGLAEAQQVYHADWPEELPR